ARGGLKRKQGRMSVMQQRHKARELHDDLRVGLVVYGGFLGVDRGVELRARDVRESGGMVALHRAGGIGQVLPPLFLRGRVNQEEPRVGDGRYHQQNERTPHRKQGPAGNQNRAHSRPKKRQREQQDERRHADQQTAQSGGESPVKGIVSRGEK